MPNAPGRRQRHSRHVHILDMREVQFVLDLERRVVEDGHSLQQRESVADDQRLYVLQLLVV